MIFHKHKWEFIKEYIDLNHTYAAWWIVEEKCKDCGKVRTRDGRIVKLQHVGIPHHHHIHRQIWRNSDYRIPTITAFCENCGRTCKGTISDESFTLRCPNCKSGSFLFIYYQPCCIEALKAKKVNMKKLVKFV